MLKCNILNDIFLAINNRDINYFDSKVFNKNGHVTLESLNKHGKDLLNKSSKEMMVEVGCETQIEPSIHKSSSAQRVISLNYTKDIGIVKNVNGSLD